jgi:hypothetical protein
MTHAEIVEFLELVLMLITWVGMNPYTVVETFKNYRPNIPLEYHSDDLYAKKPSEEVWAKFWATLKAKKMQRAEKD